MIFVSRFTKGLYKMGFVAEKNVAACSAVSRSIITLHPSPRVLLPLLWKISQKGRNVTTVIKKLRSFPAMVVVVGTAQLAFKEVKPRTGDKIESKLAFLPRQQQQQPPPRWLLAAWNRLLLSTINIQQPSITNYWRKSLA